MRGAARRVEREDTTHTGQSRLQRIAGKDVAERGKTGGNESQAGFKHGPVEHDGNGHWTRES